MKLFEKTSLRTYLFVIIVLGFISLMMFSKYFIQQKDVYEEKWKIPEKKQPYLVNSVTFQQTYWGASTYPKSGILQVKKKTLALGRFPSIGNLNIDAFLRITLDSAYETEQFKKTEKKLPQIIGIGVKKCSTGALKSYICAHPDVRCSTRELHFFNLDSNYKKGENYYKSLFPVSGKNQITFEKTPIYFSLKFVPGRIKELYTKANARVKFVLSLCDPVFRAYSDYMFSVRNKKKYFSYKKLYYSSFDEYLEHELDHVKQYLDNDGLNKLQSANDSYFSEYVRGTWDSILKGIYPFFLRQWFRVFPEKDILIIDGETLIQQPWLVMEEVQKFANLSFAIQKKHFILNKKTGFYCFLSNTNREHCLGKNKGQTRLLTNDKTVKSKMSRKSQNLLREFYSVYDKDLKNLVNKKFNWMKSDFV